MNDKINGIIVDGKVYVIHKTELGINCKGCAFVGETDCKIDYPCRLFRECSNFKFSQELTDKLNKQ